TERREEKEEKDKMDEVFGGLELSPLELNPYSSSQEQHPRAAPINTLPDGRSQPLGAVAGLLPDGHAQPPHLEGSRGLVQPEALPAALPAVHYPLPLAETEGPDSTAMTQAGCNYERKKSRAKLLRKEMNVRFEELQAILLDVGTIKSTMGIREKGAKRTAVLACAVEVLGDQQRQCNALAEEIKRLKGEGEGEAAQGAVARGKRPLSSPTEAPERMPWPIEAHEQGAPQQTAVAPPVSTASRAVFNQCLALSPLVFSFFDAQTVLSSQAVCRAWRSSSCWERCWSDLCQRRWKLSKGCEAKALAGQISCRLAYKQLHEQVRLPEGAFMSGEYAKPIALGRQMRGGVATWVALARRSNGQTLRTVLVNGAMRPLEVVELVVVVQNVGARGAVELPLQTASAGASASVLAAAAGGGSRVMREVWSFTNDGRLRPALLGKNGSRDAEGSSLRALEFATLSFHFEAPGCDAEQAFLERMVRFDLGLVVAGEGGARDTVQFQLPCQQAVQQ
ncbi:unnamed protein product, partial [Chrysoparadoxa australica]